jgi:uncharacterized metal-binding protein YceD (DUF177 family)
MRRKEKGQFLLWVKDLKEGENNLEWVVKSEALPVPDMRIKDDIRIKIRIQKSGDKLLIAGSVNFTAEITCAYCGRDFIKDFREEFNSCYLRGDEKRLPAHLALDDEEIDRVYYGGDFVNLESLIRDTIILSLPIAPQCGRH